MEFQTAHMHRLIDRIQQGDEGARDELVRSVCKNMERLAHRMLQRYPAVQRWEQTGDVLQNALLRLLRALQEIKPPSTRDFFGLAAEQIRRELLDLTRHYRGKKGMGANLATHGDPMIGNLELTDDTGDVANLERWQEFHAAVHQLPVEEREIIGLVFYHGWTQAQVAELFQTSERTIRRRWQAACLRLDQLIKGGLPDV